MPLINKVEKLYVLGRYSFGRSYVRTPRRACALSSLCCGLVLRLPRPSEIHWYVRVMGGGGAATIHHSTDTLYGGRRMLKGRVLAVDGPYTYPDQVRYCTSIRLAENKQLKVLLADLL
jgi:hypothetical protein